MLTVRGLYKNGQVVLVDDKLPIDECEVLITFLTEEDDIKLPVRKKDEMIIEYVRETRFGLTAREYEILQLAQKGLKTQQIADLLELSDGSVRNHLTSVYEKLKAENRSDAISKAIELGLLEQIKNEE